MSDSINEQHCKHGWGECAECPPGPSVVTPPADALSWSDEAPDEVTDRIRVTPDRLDGGFVAERLDMPGVISQGETREEALANLADAVSEVVGVTPPAQDEHRSRAINEARVGDRVEAVLKGTLIAYDSDLGKWTLETDGTDHVRWQIELHWAQPFTVAAAPSVSTDHTDEAPSSPANRAKAKADRLAELQDVTMAALQPRLDESDAAWVYDEFLAEFASELYDAELNLAAARLTNEQMAQGNVDPVDIIAAITQECLDNRAEIKRLREAGRG